MTGSRGMGKNLRKCPHTGVFPLWSPYNIFQDQALSLWYPYGTQTSCKKLVKIMSRMKIMISKDGPTQGPTEKGDY